MVSRTQGRDLGVDVAGKLLSQLPGDVQTQFLSYEVSVDLLQNLPNSEILDIFSRLNSYAVVLNEQERLNVKHFGPFKILADSIGRKYNEYWKTQGILSDREILRMLEVNLVADLLIAMIEGIKAKKQIGKFYGQYEKAFDKDPDLLEAHFDAVTDVISKLYPEGLSSTIFRRPFMYYSLFTTVAHCLYRLPGLIVNRVALDSDAAVQAARNALDVVDELFEVDDVATLTEEQRDFLVDSRRATTDQAVRERRTLFLLSLIT